MKNKKMLFAVIVFLNFNQLNAQQSFSVTDSTPAIVGGLQMGYHIKSVEQKAVSDKGDFSRYSLNFYITNTTPEAKIILYKQGFNILGNVSDYLVRFDCANATGARLTNKSVTLEAAPCNILASVDDKDCSSGKIVKNQRSVQIGYWIRPGETINTNCIMIVPLNEMPNMSATFLMNSVGSMASASNGNYGNIPAPIPQGFFKIRNVGKNTYINNQQGPLVCTPLGDNGWWSAQWQLVTVTGTNYFAIQNKWKNNFISINQMGEIIPVLNQSNASMWLIEPVAGSNAVRFKNAASNTYLNIESGNLQSTNIWDGAVSAEWIMEQQ